MNYESPLARGSLLCARSSFPSHLSSFASFRSLLARSSFVPFRSLLIRSSREESRGIYKNTRPDIANNTVGSTTADGYYRQVLTTEVATRNLRVL